jgi:hypothetical protein
MRRRSLDRLCLFIETRAKFKSLYFERSQMERSLHFETHGMIIIRTNKHFRAEYKRLEK